MLGANLIRNAIKFTLWFSLWGRGSHLTSRFPLASTMTSHPFSAQYFYILKNTKETELNALSEKNKEI